MITRHLIILVIAGCAPGLSFAQELLLNPIIAKAAAKSLGKRLDGRIHFDRVQRLDLRGSGLKSLHDIRFIKNLKILDISDTDVSDLSPIHDLAGLEYLDLTGNKMLTNDEVSKFEKSRASCIVLFTGNPDSISQKKEVSMLYTIDNVVRASAYANMTDTRSDGVPVPYTGRTGCLWSPDGERLAFAIKNGTGRWGYVYDTATGRPIRRLQFSRKNSSTSSATTKEGTFTWSPDGRWLASHISLSGNIQNDGAAVLIWDAISGQLIKEYVAPAKFGQRNDKTHGALIGVDWSPDGTQLWASPNSRFYPAARGYEPTPHRTDPYIWDIPEGSLTRPVSFDRVSFGLFAPLSIVPRSLAGKHFMVIGTGIKGGGRMTSFNQLAEQKDRSMIGAVWEAATGKLVYTIPISHPTSVSWSPDGKRLANSDKVMDAANGTVLSTLKRSGPVVSTAWSPDSKRIASGCLDGTVKVWDATTGKMLLDLGFVLRPKLAARSRGWVFDPYSTYPDYIPFVHISWNPDGRRLAVGSETVRVWDVTNGQLLHSFVPKAAALQKRLSPHPPSNWLDHNELRKKYGDSANAGGIKELAWSPNGRHLAAVWNNVRHLVERGSLSRSTVSALTVWGDFQPLPLPELFSSKILKLIGKPDGKIPSVKLQKIQSLDLSNKGLESTEGFNGLAELKVLDLSNNKLTSLTGLSGMANLEYLNLSGNGNLTHKQVQILQRSMPSCMIVGGGFKPEPTRKFDLLVRDTADRDTAMIASAIVKAAGRDKKKGITVTDLLNIRRLDLSGKNLGSIDALSEAGFKKMFSSDLLAGRFKAIHREFMEGLVYINLDQNGISHLKPLLYVCNNLEVLVLSGNPKLRVEDIVQFQSRVRSCLVIHPSAAPLLGHPTNGLGQRGVGEDNDDTLTNPHPKLPTKPLPGVVPTNPQRQGGQGEGKVQKPNQRETTREALIKKFDKNGDGKLDEKERPSREQLRLFFREQLPNK